MTEAESTATADVQPGDDWVAIRYNTMANRARLHMTARTTFIARHFYGISMFTRPNMTATEVARAVAPHTKHVSGKMRAVRIGDLRQAGFDIVDYEPASGHVTVKFKAKPDDDLWDRLIALMGKPEPVPYVDLGD